MELDWGLRIGGALVLAALATVLIKLIHYSVAEWVVYYHLRHVQAVVEDVYYVYPERHRPGDGRTRQGCIPDWGQDLRL